MNTISPIGGVLGANTTWWMDISINDAVLTFLQVGFILGLGMILIFSLLVIRQISLMNTTVMTPIEGKIRLMGYAYFVACAVAFLAAFVIL